MAHLITLITPKSKKAISDELILKIKQVIGEDFMAAVWLAEDEAMDILLHDELPAGIQTKILSLISALPIDYAFHTDDKRKKKLLIADMDSTMIGQECIDELADFVGIKAKVSEITERAMRGELEFNAALKERVGLLKDMPRTALQQAFDKKISLNEGARTLVQTMKANGAYTALVSGGFTFFTAQVQKQTGFDTTRANVLNFVDDKLDGTVVEPILGQQAKLDSMIEFCDMRNIELGDALAVGDGANDLAMVTKAGLGVAYHAKPIVAAQAKVAINHCDLTALLYLQGYKAEEFMG
ncbi:MAG: phosphoserine phosphatase SerB [OCS116 cluster bacterium]|uniref:Phosphoserine phosphatase n=1 Tax=OCS116 cluster bacterium TaxID=2030921 RepID=A0A2A4YT43_9PROT|nr:phosphoserine phosphatase SerB [OCS116 cluster bacterium]